MKTFDEFKRDYEATRKSFLMDSAMQKRLLGRKIKSDPNKEFDKLLINAYDQYRKEVSE
jgi:hypothetical protein